MAKTMRNTLFQEVTSKTYLGLVTDKSMNLSGLTN